MQAMILAAGLGVRLRPLTECRPKCLLEVGGKPLIDYHLYRMASLGVTEVIINTSYLADQVMTHCGDGSRYGVSIRYSHEPDQPLGAVGGIRLAMTRGLKGQFLLFSADIWADLHASHEFFQLPCDTRLLLVPSPSYHPQGDFGMSKSGKLTLLAPRYTYGGFAMLNTDSFKQNPDARSLTEILIPLIERDSAKAVLYKDYHANIGTLRDLEEAESFIN